MVASVNQSINLSLPDSFFGKSLTPAQGRVRLRLLQTQSTCERTLSPKSTRERRELMQALHNPSTFAPSVVKITRADPPSRLLSLSRLFFPLYHSPSSESYEIVFYSSFSPQLHEERKKAAQVIDLFSTNSLPLLSSPTFQWYLTQIEAVQGTPVSFFFVLRKIYRAHLSMLLQGYDGSLALDLRKQLSTIHQESLLLLKGLVIFSGCCCETELLSCAQQLSGILREFHQLANPSKDLSDLGLLTEISTLLERETVVVAETIRQIQFSSIAFLQDLYLFEKLIQTLPGHLRPGRFLRESIIDIKQYVENEVLSIRSRLRTPLPPVRNKSHLPSAFTSLCGKISYLHGMWLHSHVQCRQANDTFLSVSSLGNLLNNDLQNQRSQHRPVIQKALEEHSHYTPPQSRESNQFLLMNSVTQITQFSTPGQRINLFLELHNRTISYQRDYVIREGSKEGFGSLLLLLPFLACSVM